jgi:DNA processing protein
VLKIPFIKGFFCNHWPNISISLNEFVIISTMEELLPWLSLKSVPGIGNHLFKRLIDRFKSPQRIFNAPGQELLQVEGVTRRVVDSIRNHKISDIFQRELDSVDQKGFQIVTMLDPNYPPLLREIPDPPPFLYVFGNLEGSLTNIAMVGSRHATSYGLSMTRNLSEDLAKLGITVVSGMARGIDTAAHEGALMGKGKTIAVLGSGLDRVYPSENEKIYHRIAEQGAVISEFPLMTEPEAHNFPIRNRIICGMSLGTVVVEASKKSGSLITARLAAEQNREVFAVPGSVQSFKSTGTHDLIKQGAKLVEHAQDILEELEPSLFTRDAPNLSDHNEATEIIAKLLADEALVYNLLEPYPVHIDDLARKTALEPGKLSSILLKLELKGIVHQQPGKLFSIIER